MATCEGTSAAKPRPSTTLRLRVLGQCRTKPHGDRRRTGRGRGRESCKIPRRSWVWSRRVFRAPVVRLLSRHRRWRPQGGRGRCRPRFLPRPELEAAGSGGGGKNGGRGAAAEGGGGGGAGRSARGAVSAGAAGQAWLPGADGAAASGHAAQSCPHPLREGEEEEEEGEEEEEAEEEAEVLVLSVCRLRSTGIGAFAGLVRQWIQICVSLRSF